MPPAIIQQYCDRLIRPSSRDNHIHKPVAVYVAWCQLETAGRRCQPEGLSRRTTQLKRQPILCVEPIARHDVHPDHIEPCVTIEICYRKVRRNRGRVSREAFRLDTGRL